MVLDFEAEVLHKLEELSANVHSLNRAVQGAAEEGNEGLLARMERHERRGDRRHTDVDQRLDELERQYARAVAWIAGAAAAGGGVGAIVALAFDLRGLFNQ